LKLLLEVSALVKDEILSPRFFASTARNRDTRPRLLLNEKHRDLLSLIMALHHIECQYPLQRKLLLCSRFTDEFDNIKADLENLFLLLTARPIELIFRSRPSAGSQATMDHRGPREPILLSGGIDSISGAVKCISENPRNVLVHVCSSKPIFGKVKKLLAHGFFSNTEAFFFDARIKSARHRSFLSDTRGLLYLTAGYVASRHLKSTNLVFCENGGQMLDAMFGSEVYGIAKATKNTNLRYLALVEELLSKFEGAKFGVLYPFKNSTKAEMISTYLNADLVQKSWSCYSARERRMCGFCWNCFITRMSALASGVPYEALAFSRNPLVDTDHSRLFLDNQRILYNLMVFYERVVNGNRLVIEELKRYDHEFQDPVDLATRFGLDLFIGISALLSNAKKKNGLGRKACECLSRIDSALLQSRREHLESLRRPN
jgi:hypothetical protein